MFFLLSLRISLGFGSESREVSITFFFNCVKLLLKIKIYLLNSFLLRQRKRLGWDKFWVVCLEDYLHFCVLFFFCGKSLLSNFGSLQSMVSDELFDAWKNIPLDLNHLISFCKSFYLRLQKWPSLCWNQETWHFFVVTFWRWLTLRRLAWRALAFRRLLCGCSTINITLQIKILDFSSCLWGSLWTNPFFNRAFVYFWSVSLRWTTI